MGVLDGQAVSAAVTNAAFLNKNSADTMPYNLSIAAALNFPKNTISTAGTINALDSSKANIKLTGASVVLNGITGGTDGEVVIIQNTTGSSITINSLSGSAAAADQIKLVSSSYSMPNDGGAIFLYDSTQTKWVVVATMDSMTATDLNTASAIVKRDASGNFIASQASLSSLLLRGSSSGTVTVSPPATVTSYALTLPNAQGASQTTLVNDGTGALTWGTVGSGGSKNYFSQSNINPTFETGSVSPWSACTLGFSGGAPTGSPTLTATQMSIATSSSTPLMGTYSMRLTHAAANAQYQGFISGAFTIDREDLAKVMYGSFSYELISGTADFSGSTTQTLEIWIYNTVSGVWTQPAGYRGMNQGSGQGLVTFSFQTDSTAANNSYRIAVITQQTSTSAYVVAFDDFKIGPSAILVGPVMSDWVSYTPTWTGLTVGNAIQRFFWRRNGDSIEIKGNFQFGTTTSVSGKITFTLPSGLSLDNNKNPFPSTALGYSRLGSSSVYISGSGVKSSLIVIQDGTLLNAFYIVGKDGTTVIDPLNNTSFTWTSGSEIEIIELTVPISGWSSTTQLSQDTDTRVVAMSVGNSTSTLVLTTSDQTLPFNAVSNDTHNAYSTSTNYYTFPVSGYFTITADVLYNVSGFTSGSAIDTAIYLVGGSSLQRTRVYVGGATFLTGVATYTGYFSAGQQVYVASSKVNTGCTANFHNDAAFSRFYVTRLSGPSVIAATETVAMIAKNSSGQSIPTGSSTTITGWTKDYDSHGAFNASTGIYTAPISGEYSVKCGILYSQATVAIGAQYSIQLQKNGSDYIVLGGRFTETTQSVGVSVGGSGSVRLNAGETINIQTYQASGGARSLTSASSWNFLVIERVGN